VVSLFASVPAVVAAGFKEQAELDRQVSDVLQNTDWSTVPDEANGQAESTTRGARRRVNDRAHGRFTFSVPVAA
jgi:hypothetical protein